MRANTAFAALLLILSANSMPAMANTPWHPHYGDEILFQVYREGEPVGFYRQHFYGDGDNWHTRIAMELKIDWWLWSYSYRYEATERWQGRELQQLDVLIDRNGDETRYQLAEGDPVLGLDTSLLPTHHYNAAIVDQQQVFNTLSWATNRVTIDAQENHAVSVGTHSVSATRYRYDGELTDVESWYDPDGRWVGLRFKDSSGGTLEFRCVLCGQEEAL